MSRRIEWIDRMRGLAILSVVVQHLTGHFENQFVYHKLIGISNMAVFFFVSGYIIEKTARMENMADAWAFLKKKTVQLLWPLCVWQLVCNKFFFHTDWALWTLGDVTGVFTQPSLWFLLTLYGYMFAFAGYRLLCKYMPMGGGKLCYWIVPQGLLALLWVLTGEFKLATLYMPYFAMGVLCSSCGKEAWLANKTTATFGVLVVCLATCFWTSGSTSVLNIALKVLVSFSVIQLIYILCNECEWNKRVDGFVQHCGVSSLAIYILHWTFLAFAPYKPLLPQNELLALALISLWAILIAWACCQLYSFLARFPVLRLLLFGKSK